MNIGSKSKLKYFKENGKFHWEWFDMSLFDEENILKILEEYLME